ncbi:ComF family protein [Thalassospiraceae bacterium LMO-JJ14]|nr:ComF family protein [Thalassospiraceae bacterium LMO-JJ14]
MAHEIKGSWRKGFAFDLHTVDSVYLGVDQFGHDRFDNTRSEMGELLYQLKYKGNKSAVAGIIKLLSRINGIETFDAIVPVPSSAQRAIQPVDEIAKALGISRGVKVLMGCLSKKAGPELKNVDFPEERAALLEDAISLSGDVDLAGKKVLLLDDLFRSGATLEACTKVLRDDAKAGDICALTMTRTRSNR